MAIREQCPNCGSVWAPGSEEWDWQQCDCCGWPDNMDEEDSDDDNDFDYWDEDDERNDPNDSRNI